MNNSVNPRKRLLALVLALVVVVGLLATMHMLVNSVDLLAFLRGLHGG